MPKSRPGLPSAAAVFLALAVPYCAMAQAADATVPIVIEKIATEQHGTSYQTATIVKLREASVDSEDAVRFMACYHDLSHVWAAT